MASITAATSTSPRRCGSSNSGSPRHASPGAKSLERRRALPRTPVVASPNSSATPNSTFVASARVLEHAHRDAALEIRLAERVVDHLGQGEHREDRDDVGQRLVEGGLVGQRRLEEARAQAVEDRVGRLVADDVVREAGVHRAPVGSRQVAEEDPAVLASVVGVRLGEGPRHDVELVGARSASRCVARARTRTPPACAPRSRRRSGRGTPDLRRAPRCSPCGNRLFSSLRALGRLERGLRSVQRRSDSSASGSQRSGTGSTSCPVVES